MIYFFLNRHVYSESPSSEDFLFTADICAYVEREWLGLKTPVSASLGVHFFLSNRETTEAREVSRKPAPRNSLESEEYVKDIIGLLNAKDFRDRINGIKQLLSDTENNQGFVVANIVKVTVWKHFISKVFEVASQSFLIKILAPPFNKCVWLTGKHWGIGEVCSRGRYESYKSSKGRKREEEAESFPLETALWTICAMLRAVFHAAAE